MARSDSIEVLNSTDTMLNRLAWTLFASEQVSRLFAPDRGPNIKGKPDWVPGKPLYTDPRRRLDYYDGDVMEASDCNCAHCIEQEAIIRNRTEPPEVRGGGQHVRPMYQIYFDGDAHARMRCENCDTLWNGPEPCFNCGELYNSNPRFYIDPKEQTLNSVRREIEQLEPGYRSEFEAELERQIALYREYIGRFIIGRSPRADSWWLHEVARNDVQLPPELRDTPSRDRIIYISTMGDGGQRIAFDFETVGTVPEDSGDLDGFITFQPQVIEYSVRDVEFVQRLYGMSEVVESWIDEVNLFPEVRTRRSGINYPQPARSIREILGWAPRPPQSQLYNGIYLPDEIPTERVIEEPGPDRFRHNYPRRNFDRFYLNRPVTEQRRPREV